MSRRGQRQRPQQSQSENDGESRPRNAAKVQRKWKENESMKVLEYLRDSVASGFGVEKAKASLYFANFLIKNRKLPNPDEHLPPSVTVPLLISHVNNIKKGYKKALAWSMETGQGVKEDAGEESFRAALLKKCKYWDLCHEIWGHRTNVRIPDSAETTQVGPPSDHDDDDDNSITHNTRSVSRERSRSPVSRNSSPGGRRSESPELFRPNEPQESPSDKDSQQSTSTGPYNRKRSRVRSTNHPGRRLDKGGEKLAKSFHHRGPKEAFEEMRERMESQRLQFQQDQLKLQQQQLQIDTRRLDGELDLKREQFEYTKMKDVQALELEREATRREQLKVDGLKLKLELAKLGIQTTTD